MKSFAQLILFSAFTLVASAQDSTVKLKIRAVLHHPLSPYAELYVPGATGDLERLNLAFEGLTIPQTATASKGILNLYSSATVDAAKPLENLVASVKIPENTKQAIILIFPAGKDSKLPFRLMVLNDAFHAFAKGESRAINLTPLTLAIRVGEHSIKVPPAKIVPVPKVTKLNDLNQAQTSFYRKDAETWVLLSERPMQYADEVRNIFLLYLMPNVDEPQVRTLIDTSAPS